MFFYTFGKYLRIIFSKIFFQNVNTFSYIHVVLLLTESVLFFSSQMNLYISPVVIHLHCVHKETKLLFELANVLGVCCKTTQKKLLAILYALLSQFYILSDRIISCVCQC